MVAEHTKCTPEVRIYYESKDRLGQHARMQVRSLLQAVPAYQSDSQSGFHHPVVPCLLEHLAMQSLHQSSTNL